jgi:ribosome biogenesis GTPase
MSDLESIGYSDWFKCRVVVEKIAVHVVAQFVSVHKDSYTVSKGGEALFRKG